jgi:acyl-CoA reductase-like NAD-dependent aldehyde dehydrogenase
MAYKLLIDGKLVPGALELDVVNPATGKVFATAARADKSQAEQAIAAAKRAFPAWSGLSYPERRKYLNAFADAIKSRSEEFARLLTQENGKPLSQAKDEIEVTWLCLRHFAGQEVKSKTIRENEVERIVEQRYPQGVVAAITPWNFPVILLMFKLGAALITGNTVIAKPAPTTPLTTLLLGEVAAEILPPGVFQTIVDANDLGSLLTSHPDVAHVSFTGSTPTGKKVLVSTSETLKRFTLELGGNDPAIILDDADLDQVVPKIYLSAILNAGQVCYAIKRIYVPRPLVDKVCDKLVQLAGESKVGDGFDPSTTIGPIQNKLQYEKLLGYLEDSRKVGRILSGGKPLPGDGYFLPVTVVRDLTDSARVVREEQFGPIIPIVAYDTDDEAVANANSTEFGLGGSIWTSDLERGTNVASRIETGTIWINQHLSLPFDVPFGGAKQSGLGLQNGIEGMEDFTQLRVLNAALTAVPLRMPRGLQQSRAAGVAEDI